VVTPPKFEPDIYTEYKSTALLLYHHVLARPELGEGESGNDELESKGNEDDELHIVDRNEINMNQDVA
jgi:hypothetical protein